jgi:predicted transcriptional regulator
MPKAAPAREIPPTLELICLKALWSLQEGNVQQVRNAIAPSRPLAYTTIMTVLERLARKGFVGRRKAGRAFVYAPQVGREEMRRTAVREFVATWFDGSETALAAYLAGAREPEPPRVEARLDTALL